MSFKTKFRHSPSNGINHWISNLKTNNEPTILNLDTNNKISFKDKLKINATKYKEFNTFFDSTVKKVSDELDNNQGPIIEFHLPDTNNNDENNKALTEIVYKYKELYLNNLTNDGNHKLTDKFTDKLTDKQESYPNYLEDLYKKNDKPYVDFEIKNGITKPIVEQNDDEFLETLKLRIKGLQKCIQNNKNQYEYIQYFNNEYNKENKTYDSHNVNEQCKSIYYSDKMLKDSSEITRNTELQTEVFKYYDTWLSETNEIEFAKTFLPSDFFINQKKKTDDEFKNELQDKIKILIKENNRDIRQFVFGFFKDNEFEYLQKLKPFLFEVGGMLKHKTCETSCNPLVNWSIILNMIYSRCSITNTNVLCPVRFIIPSDVISNYNSHNSTLEFEIRDRYSLINLFNKDTKNNFIGIITIKYFHEQTQTYRIWFLYIFDNNNILDLDQSKINTITGLQEKYFIVNSNLKFVNTGSLFERHNVTHTELTFFSELSNRNIIFFYKTKLDNRNIFISTYNNLHQNKTLLDLGIIPINITLKKNKYKNNIYPTHSFLMENKEIVSHIGGVRKDSNINKYYNIKLISNDSNIIYSDPEISGAFFNTFYNNTLTILNIYSKNDLNRNKFFKILNYLNHYYLLNIEYEFAHIKLTTEIRNKITIYKPISGITFYNNYEILNKFNILNNINKNSNILYLGTDYSFIEVLKYNNYKANNITSIITTNNNYFKKAIDNWTTFINNISKIYKTNIIYFNNKLYDLLNLQDLNNNKYDLLYYDIYTMYTPVENYNNLAILFMGLIIGLKYTQHGGTFIMHFGSVAYKNVADIYIIISEYFKNHNLYYPEISNLYKKRGTYGIFTGFKGISDTEFNDLLKLLDKTNKIYINDGKDFNIYDKNLRKKLHISKPINPDITIQKNIVEFINNKLMKNKKIDDIYNYIKNFNNERYYKQLSFTYKLLELLKQPNEYINNLKVPTQEQLTNAILYCKKYDIPYIDKFSKSAFQDKFGKQILQEAYGLHEPIIYKFKTPFTLKIRPSLLSIKTKKAKQTKKNKKTKLSKTTKKSLNSFNFSTLFNNDDSIYSPSPSPSPYKTRKNKYTSKSLKKNYSNKGNLIPELHTINNRIEQTTKLIDSRRNFDAPESMQNINWFEANKQFRYYKHKDDKDKIHLDKKVQKLLGDFNISQAWLKMYEIITNCDLIPKQRKGTYKSFHICEAPGTFINCINNYIHTKTKYDAFDWKAQSLKSIGKGKNKDTAFGDDFGLIKRHKDRWDFGVDGSGDITKIINIKHYEKVIKDMKVNNNGVDLITSDCGLPMKCEGYEKVAFASLLTILSILPKGGSMVYKILTPIDEPIILNLIYIAYTNFKELIFFKPVQNSQSREFYIVGKGYLGTEISIIDKFFDELKKFKEGEEVDLYNDIYPDPFIKQMIKASTSLADNFVYTIERQIYFVDNKDTMPTEFTKIFYNYYNEKNEDWIRKYKPLRLDKKFNL
jgi:hypothetical protein